MNETRWHDVAEAATIPDGDIVAALVDGREIGLVRLGEALHAIDATCTHGNASLCGGFVEPDGSVECPLHQGRFDIRNGQPTCDPVTDALRTYPVRIEGGRVLLRLD